MKGAIKSFHERREWIMASEMIIMIGIDIGILEMTTKLTIEGKAIFET